MPSTFFSLRRRLYTGALSGLLLLGLSACTAVTEDARATIQYAFSKPTGVSLSEAEVAAFPYTGLYVNWDESPRILMVLGYVDGNEFSWISGQRETMVTRHGRIVRTAGVDYELVGISNIEADPLRCLVTSPDHCATHWQRELDISNQNRTYSRSVSSEFTVAGSETLELASASHEVTHIIERGRMGKRSFKNEFWVEADGHVVKSRQQIVPERVTLTLEQMKWVGR